jgi:hypothetical protein
MRTVDKNSRECLSLSLSKKRGPSHFMSEISSELRARVLLNSISLNV